MIIIPSGTGIPSGLHMPSDHASSSQNTGDEDDIHICGSCKEQFTDIFLFMRHKSDGNCRSRHGKKHMSVTVPSGSCSTRSNAIFTPLGGTGIHTIRPETKYTRVSLVNTEAFTIEKEDSSKEESSSTCQDQAQSSLAGHPPHLLLADIASQRLSLQNQNESNVEKSAENEMSLEDDWDLSWSAAKVLGTFSISNSLKKLQNQNLSILKENSQIQEEGSVKIVNVENDTNVEEQAEPPQADQEHLQSCEDCTLPPEKHKQNQIHDVEDSQIPERFVGPDGGLLDVEDVEVATLLANHLANEPSLHIYPNSSEAFLSYGNVQNQLVIPTSSDTLSFANECNRDKVLDSDGKKCESRDGSLISEGQYISDPPKTVEVSPSKVLSDKTSKTVRKRKYHSCPNEGCKFQGTSVRDLNRHIRKHTGERPFKCPECEKTFTRRDKLSVHLRCHGGGKTYQCKVCEFSCRDRSGLVIHMRRHNDERPYKCQICEHRARTKSHLNVHLRKHTGDHPYKCKKCGRAFTTSSDLTRHSRLHSGDKPYTCPHCSYSAALKTSLRTHIQQNHLSGVSLVCPKCNLQCESRKDLRNHLKTHKDDPKRCTKCDFVGSTNTALKNHLKVHDPERLKQSPLLNGKRGAHRFHQKKKFSPKKPKKTIEDFPEVHNCAYCNGSFWREDTLEEHVRQHQLEELVSARAPASQDPVLADSADSRDSTDSTSMDVTCGLAGLAALASYHSASEQASSEQQPAFLYRYISGSQSNDNLRNAEILASLNQSSGNLPQYVAIQTEQNTLVDALNCIQYVLPSPLGTLDDNDNATSLLC